MPCTIVIEKKPGAAVQKRGAARRAAGANGRRNDWLQLGAGFRGPSHMNGHLTFDVSGPVGLTTGFDVSRQGTNYGYLIDQRSTYAWC